MKMNQKKKPKDNFWRNLIGGFVFLSILAVSSFAGPIGGIIVFTGCLIMALEYFHYRYIEDIKEVLKRESAR